MLVNICMKVQKYAIQSYGSCALHIVPCCFTFVYSVMKISQMVFELQSGHDFVTDDQGKNNPTGGDII